jgi:hypothetical protein
VSFGSIAADDESPSTILVPAVRITVNEHTHTSKAGVQFDAEVIAQAVRNLPDCKLRALLVTGK